MTNLELVKSGYEKFSEGDIEGVLTLFDPQIKWFECIGFPFIEGDGIFIGPEAIANDIFQMIPEYYENFNIEIEDLIESGDRVIMAGYYTGIWKPTGKTFKANAAHVWTVRDGKVTRFFQAVDTATIVNPG